MTHNPPSPRAKTAAPTPPTSAQTVSPTVASGTQLPQAAKQELPPSLIASVLARVRKDKEIHVREEWEAQRVKADAADATARQDALLATLRKAEQGTLDRVAREEQDAQRAKSQASSQLAARDLRRDGVVQARILEFRGSSDASITQRLRTEGFADALLENKLRERTLDQQVGGELGMKPGQGKEPEALYAPGGGRDALYASEQSLYRSDVPESVRGTESPVGMYESTRDKDREAGVRKGLGLDTDLGLGYGRSK